MIASLIGSPLTAMHTEQKKSHSDSEVESSNKLDFPLSERQDAFSPLPTQTKRAGSLPPKIIAFKIQESIPLEEPYVDEIIERPDPSDPYSEQKYRAALAQQFTEAWYESQFVSAIKP